MRMKFYNQKYADDILGKAKAANVPGYEWQDIAQEFDIALWKNLPKFQARNGANERTFVITVIRNKLLDLVKSVNRKKRRIDSYHSVFSRLEATEEGLFALECATPIG